MRDIKWSHSEKALARRVFDLALNAELEEIVTEFKTRAASIEVATQMWELRGFLASKEREIEEKYDFRYSQLILVFGRLLREGRLQGEQLEGLAEDKLSLMRRVASM